MNLAVYGKVMVDFYLKFGLPRIIKTGVADFLLRMAFKKWECTGYVYSYRKMQFTD